MPWQLVNRFLRLGSIWCLLHAVGLPTGVAVVLATGPSIVNDLDDRGPQTMSARALGPGGFNLA